MREEKLIELLRQLPDSTTEQIPPELGDKIKSHIPTRLARHKVTWETVNIVIDLRMSRSIAAAVIVIAVILLSTLFGGRSFIKDNFYEDSKLMIKYGLAGENAYRPDVLDKVERFYEDLLSEGRDVTYYGKSMDPDNKSAVIMHWQLPDGQYRIIYNDLSTRTISPASLIRLQDQMLKSKLKK